MGKFRFVSNNVKRIDLSDGDWVDIKEQLSFEDFSKVFEGQSIPSEPSPSVAIPLLKAALIDWSFEDGGGRKIPCSPENIGKLDASTVLELVEPIIGNYTPEKKSSQSLKPTSKDIQEKGQKTNG